MIFEALPVELIADVLSELDLQSLITVCYLSRRLHHVASDPSLNPWRGPILRNLLRGPTTPYEPALAHLSVRTVVPRRNWIEVLSRARAHFILFQMTLPNLADADWEECFGRRFLPSWRKWRKDGRWREAFLKVMNRMWHRSVTSCTADEAWTKYVVLNRNGSVNELDASSRTYSPLTVFNEMKFQNDLAHLETRIRLVVEFTDVRILALGVLNRPRGFLVNPNAKAFLHPPGIESDEVDDSPLELRPENGEADPSSPDGAELTLFPSSSSSDDYLMPAAAAPSVSYERLTHPLPAESHASYPLFTSGGRDKRWLGTGELEENGLTWVGGLMITAQLIAPPRAHDAPDDGEDALHDMGLVIGAGRHQYASFAWADLLAIAPWMEERVTKVLDGPGLGN